ncbi:MAG: hypothetical protein OXQ29_02630 [Rhodospirillaceae bacterium]|nr:hypothetical protein [Rhodospirillaceae bacterium]
MRETMSRKELATQLESIRDAAIRHLGWAEYVRARHKNEATAKLHRKIAETLLDSVDEVRALLPRKQQSSKGQRVVKPTHAMLNTAVWPRGASPR